MGKKMVGLIFQMEVCGDRKTRVKVMVQKFQHLRSGKYITG